MIPVGRTLYKKKDGILTVTPDYQNVTWTPDSGGPPTVSLPISSVTNLQQTPDTSAKVMLRIFEKPAGGGENVTYLFDFKTSEAREEAKAVKDLLSKLLADLRSSDPSVPKPTGASTPATTNGNGGGSASASMAFASAVNATPHAAKWYDDSQLKNDIELQQSLMKKDRTLHQMYMEAVSTKPESISGAAFNAQFWSARTNMLRAHAIEINQKKGAYNVLSTVKPRTVDGDLKLNLSVEQVQMIFAQHPLVKRIYNENVPKLSEAQFWSRFFLSRLSKKLRGERVNDNDPLDALFDKHDVSENTHGFQNKIMAQSVPHIIDIEGNEENQGGFRSGNAKDVEMRPRTHIPIVRTLNSLSEKIMANVAPSDQNETNDTYSQFALRDLRGDAEDSRIALNVKEQNKFFSKHDAAPSTNARVFATQNPSDVLSTVRSALNNLDDSNGGIDLAASIGIDEESDSEDDARTPHVGSRASTRTADTEIMDGLKQRRAQAYSSTTDDTTPMGLPASLAEKCALTHATTMEFLHQFWSAFLSGDPDRATELQYLAESLSRSAERVAAVAEEAEREREAAIEKRKQEIRDIFKRTGEKKRWKAESMGGGKGAVEKMTRPVLEALEKARAEYARALAAEGVKVSSE